MGAGSILFSSNELTLRDLVFSPPILPLILKLLSFFFFFNPSDMLDQDSSFGSPDLTKSGTEALAKAGSGFLKCYIFWGGVQTSVRSGVKLPRSQAKRIKLSRSGYIMMI